MGVVPHNYRSAWSSWQVPSFWESRKCIVSDRILVLQFAGCVSLGKLDNFSELQFLFPRNIPILTLEGSCKHWRMCILTLGHLFFFFFNPFCSNQAVFSLLLEQDKFLPVVRVFFMSFTIYACHQQHSFIHLCNRYLLSAFSVLGARDVSMYETNKDAFLLKAYIPVRRIVLN